MTGGRRELTDTECHRAANYGAQVRRVRGLVSPRGSKPVWTFVELGHPMSQDHWPRITPPQIRAAVWHSLIAGARGITYFNHSFGGRCQTQHACCGIPAMRACGDGQGDEQADQGARPVLNAPFVTSRWTHSQATKAMVKWKGGHFYVFAVRRRMFLYGLVLDPVRGQRDRHRPRREARDPGPRRVVQRLLRRRQRGSHLPHRRRLGLRSDPTV